MIFPKLFLVGLIAVLLLFTTAWIIQLRTKNGAIADVAWGYSFPILATLYMWMNQSHQALQYVTLGLTLFWGVRLGTYLFIRGINKPEDARYTALRREWGNRQNLFMLRFFYFQALLALVLSSPFALIMSDACPKLSSLPMAGLSICCAGIVGETIADHQLSKFKNTNRNNSTAICNIGLWKYSRHPNYFFEWLIWVGFSLIALNSPHGTYAIISPVLMYIFLTKITGIAYTEAHMLKTRGRPFEEYQKNTSSFFPLPKLKSE